MDSSVNNNVNVYTTSKQEMVRRKRAFLSLWVSFLIVFVICSLDFYQCFPEIAICGISIFFAFLCFSQIMVNRLLNKQCNLKIYLSNGILEHSFGNSHQKYSLTDVQNIRIKRTVKNTIREITIFIKGQRVKYINGLNDFEEFNDDLIRYSGKNAKLINKKEPLDYDHPFFYPVLGVVTGSISAFLIRLMLSIGDTILKYAQSGFTIFAVCIGLYFIYRKPIAGRYSKKVTADYITGTLMIVISLCLRLFK